MKTVEDAIARIDRVICMLEDAKESLQAVVTPRECVVIYDKNDKVIGVGANEGGRVIYDVTSDGKLEPHHSVLMREVPQT